MTVADITDALRRISVWDLTVVLGGFLACVAPGFLVIFLFDPSLVRELESLKLIFLSAALTLPLVTLNAFALAGVGPFVGALGGAGKYDRKHIVFWLLTWTFLVLYIALAIKAFVWALAPGAFLILVIVLDIALAFPIMKTMRLLASSDEA